MEGTYEGGVRGSCCQGVGCESTSPQSTLKPILRSSQSWLQPLSLRLRHSLTWQPRSSEPSPQSSWPLHSRASATQRPLPHRNCEEALHLCSGGEGGGQLGAGTRRGQPGRGLGSGCWCPPGLVQCGFLGASSLWSWQSFSPSHSHCRELRQRPLAQRNSVGPQVGYSEGRGGDHPGGVTQAPGKGLAPIAPRAPGSPHSGDSSEPSAQSRSWSHTKCLGMHWRFWHMNSRSSHVLLYTVDAEWMDPIPAMPDHRLTLPTASPCPGRALRRAETSGVPLHREPYKSAYCPLTQFPLLHVSLPACCLPQPPFLFHSQQPAVTLSSAPSAQSLSPSQSQRSGTHTWVPGQEKEEGPHVLPSVEVVEGTERPRKRWRGQSLGCRAQQKGTPPAPHPCHPSPQ